MASLTDIVIPTTETVAKDLPDLPRDEFQLPSNTNTALLAILTILAVLISAYAAADVILPIILAIVLKFLLEPGMRALSRLHFPRVLSAFLLIVAAFSAIVAIGAIVAGPAESWATHLPSEVPKIEQKLQSTNALFGKLMPFVQDLETSKPLHSTFASAVTNLGLTETLFRGTQHFASGLFETVLVLFFLLISGDLFLRRLVEIMPRFKDKRQVVDLSQQIENNISAYLATITLMNTAVGLATGLIMWACGMSNPALWGVIAFLLNFVPIMGPLLGIAIFFFEGLLEMPNLWWAMLPAALYFVVHVLEGETITPILLARRFTLNPVLVIISLIFWFWMWGVPGAILSVPMLAIAKIICDGTKPLNAIGHFLEGD